MEREEYEQQGQRIEERRDRVIELRQKREGKGERADIGWEKIYSNGEGKEERKRETWEQRWEYIGEKKRREEGNRDCTEAFVSFCIKRIWNNH